MPAKGKWAHESVLQQRARLFRAASVEKKKATRQADTTGSAKRPTEIVGILIKRGR